jgi:hypothetical protein
MKVRIDSIALVPWTEDPEWALKINKGLKDNALILSVAYDIAFIKRAKGIWRKSSFSFFSSLT